MGVSSELHRDGRGGYILNYGTIPADVDSSDVVAILSDCYGS